MVTGIKSSSPSNALESRHCSDLVSAARPHWPEQFVVNPDAYFDLEDPLDLPRLDAPRQTLAKLTGLVVIDEIQLKPEILPLLRVAYG